MIRGLLTDPACAGDNAARADADSDSYEWAELHTDRQIARRIAWQTRDLDRRLTKDSDEVTTW